jgi:lipoate---protein ligase
MTKRKAQNIHKSKKLIKITLEYDEWAKTISSIAITGDFFVYPEEKLEELELNLIGTELQRDAIMNKIEKCLVGSEPFGFDSQSMTDAILGCLDACRNNIVTSQ